MWGRPRSPAPCGAEEVPGGADLPVLPVHPAPSPSANPPTATSPSTCARPTARRPPVSGRELPLDRATADRGLLPGRRLRPQRLGRGSGGPLSRSTAKPSPARRPTTAGSRFTGSMRSQVEILQAASPDAVICVGALRRLRRVCARCGGSGAPCSDRQPLLRRQREPGPVVERGREDPEPYNPLAGQFPGGAQLRGCLGSGGPRIPGT